MGAHLLGQPQPGKAEVEVHPANQLAMQKLESLREKNVELMTQLRTYGMAMDPSSVILTKIASLTEVLFPSGTPEGQAKQIEAEVAFETAMAGILAEARRNAVSAQLAAGAQVPPAFLEDMAKHNGVPPGLRK